MTLGTRWTTPYDGATLGALADAAGWTYHAMPDPGMTWRGRRTDLALTGEALMSYDGLRIAEVAHDARFNDGDHVEVLSAWVTP